MGATAAAIIIHKEHEVVDAFRRAGALAPAAARPLDEVGVDDGLAMRRLRSRAVIRESGAGHFYLDEGVWAATRRTRRRVVIVTVTLLLVIAVGTALGFIRL